MADKYDKHPHALGADNPQVKAISQRLKTIEGHVRGVQRMVEDGAYCIDVMKQMKAIKQAIEKANSLILETHLTHCVASELKSEERDRVIQEVVDVFNATGKL